MADTPTHPATAEILRYFEFDHLPMILQGIPSRIHDLAHDLARTLDGPELTAGLRKLLEAKDCFVRAAVPKPDAEVQTAVHGLLADLGQRAHDAKAGNQ